MEEKILQAIDEERLLDTAVALIEIPSPTLSAGAAAQWLRSKILPPQSPPRARTRTPRQFDSSSPMPINPPALYSPVTTEELSISILSIVPLP